MSDQQTNEIDLTQPIGQPTPGGRYEEMVSGNPAPKETFGDETFSGDRTGLQEAADEVVSRRQPTREEVQAKEPIERAYQHAGGENAGKPMPANETVSAEQAGHDLETIRDAERAADLAALDAELLQQLDAVRAEEIQPPQIEPNPVEEIPPRPEGAAGEQSDKMTRLFVENPELLQTFQAFTEQAEQKVTAAQQQAAQYAEQARQQYGQVIAHNANVALASMFSHFPETRGMSAEQINAALPILEKSNPERGAAIRSHITNVTRMAAEAAQMQTQQLQTVYQQHQQAFAQMGAQADEAYDKWAGTQEPDTGRRREISSFATSMLRNGGMSDQEISYHWNTSPLLRSPLGQQILFDAARYRMAQAAAKQKAVRPVPTVQRPGSPVARGSDQDYSMGKLNAQLDRTGSVKDATALLIARRGSRR